MRVLLSLLLAIGLAGCTTRIGDLTVATPKNLPGDFQEFQRVTGKDCAYSLLSIIPLGTLNPTVDGAIDDALQHINGADALTDASIYNDLMFTLIFNSHCIRIEGTAVRTGAPN